MDVESGNNPAYERKAAVSRRAAPLSSGSPNPKSHDTNNKPKGGGNVGSPSTSSNLTIPSIHKKREDDDDDEAQQFLGKREGPASDAAKFVDSYLGAMIKVRAKQAGRHVYNLRANMASKKGFHVQVPKRMLFYTGLIFLVLPLMLFFREEKQIHHQSADLMTHHESKLNEQQQHLDADMAPQGYDAGANSAERLRRNPKKKHRKKKKADFQQLLGVNISSFSNSRKDYSKKVTHPEVLATAASTPPGTDSSTTGDIITVNVTGSILTDSDPSIAVPQPPSIGQEQQPQQQQEPNIAVPQPAIVSQEEQQQQPNETPDDRLQRQDEDNQKAFLDAQNEQDPANFVAQEDGEGGGTDEAANVNRPPPAVDEANTTQDHVTHDEERRGNR